MNIGGWQKYSTIDFPGKLATVLFTRGCNFRCPYCHNGQLWSDAGETSVPMEEFFSFLDRRRHQIDGLVISGGEPTLQPDLEEFLGAVREYGLPIKLDTNGSNYEVLKRILEGRLVDFVAMDLKHIFAKYQAAVGVDVDINTIKKSMQLIESLAGDYEFRTTVVPSIHSLDDIRNLSNIVKGARRFSIQIFVPDHAADKRLRSMRSFTVQDLEAIRPLFSNIAGVFYIK